MDTELYIDDESDLPWYKKPTLQPPFRLNRIRVAEQDEQQPLHCLALFPWTVESLETLWNGERSEELLDKWTEITDNYEGVVALGATNELHIIRTTGLRSDLSINVRVSTKDKAPITCVAWALHPAGDSPLVVFACQRLLCFFDVEARKLVGCLRGHGGDITSITAHPVYPTVICTTSRDTSSRVYDLEYKPAEGAESNPRWLPGEGPSRGGAPHGLRSTESEGTGIGRCVAVFVGGRSGGHQADVLSAAFHPTLPLLATCGLDRAIKIWQIPADMQGSKSLSRIDKPLFNTTVLHTARVLSVHWLSFDVLISHSAPTIFRQKVGTISWEEEGETIYRLRKESGSIKLWRWLGVDRFFPPTNGVSRYQVTLRGCASDYQESASFHVMSEIPLPYPPSSLHMSVFDNGVHDPLVILPFSESIRILNVAHFSPPEPAPFPLEEVDEITDAVEGLTISGDGGDLTVEIREETWQEGEGWEINVDSGDERVEATQMGSEGDVLVAIGSKGSVWVWHKDIEA